MLLVCRGISSRIHPFGKAEHWVLDPEDMAFSKTFLIDNTLDWRRQTILGSKNIFIVYFSPQAVADQQQPPVT